MNIQKAKSVARIPAHVSVTGRVGAERALAYCKSEIVSARKSGDDARAAAVSEAKEFFKKRAGSRNRCATCWAVINRGATHCAICATIRSRKILPPLDSTPAQRKKASRRVDVSPEGGWLARYGFYAGPVQKVLRKWTGKVSQSRIREYFTTIAEPMVFRPATATLCEENSAVSNTPPLAEPEPNDPDFLTKHHAVWIQRRNALLRTRRGFTLRFPYVGPKDWSCIFELGQALDEVLQDKSKPESWLIRFPIWVATDGKQDDWPEVAAQIRQRGGPAFKVNTITQAARRLRMLTPRPIQAAYRRATATL